MEPPGYVRTSASPGSAQAIKDRNRAAWPGRVVELRFNGVYLPANLILERQIHTGWIVSQSVGPQEWTATLFTSLKEERSPIAPLTQIRDIRLNEDGTYYLQGFAWDAGYLKRWPQDWLCGPGDESVVAALRKMQDWLRKRYTGAYGRKY